MMIHEITEKVGKHKKRKRIGRGPGSGTGKTSGRGHKGAKSRSGWSGSIHPMYEGGATPYFRRIPKRGFTNANFTKTFVIVNLSTIDKIYEAGETVSPETLVDKGFAAHTKNPVKILGNGDLTKKVTVKAHKFSAAARTKIEAAGGTIEELAFETEYRAKGVKKGDTAPAPKKKKSKPAPAPEATEAPAPEADKAEETTDE